MQYICRVPFLQESGVGPGKGEGPPPTSDLHKPRFLVSSHETSQGTEGARLEYDGRCMYDGKDAYISFDRIRTRQTPRGGQNGSQNPAVDRGAGGCPVSNANIALTDHVGNRFYSAVVNPATALLAATSTDALMTPAEPAVVNLPNLSDQPIPTPTPESDSTDETHLKVPA